MLSIPSLFKKFCDAVWEYDADTNAIYFHYDDMNPEFCDQWVALDRIDTLYRDRYVHPLDMEIWEHYLTPEGLRRFIDGGSKEEHFYIRFENTRHGKEWHEVYFYRLEGRRLLLMSRDIKEEQRNAMIAQAVVAEYDYVCCIDVATQSYVLYYSDPDKTIVPQSASDNYHRTLNEYNQMYVIPEEVTQLTDRMQLEQVCRELEEKGEYILYATVKEFGHLAYKKLRFVYKDGERDKILLTRTDIGELVGERKLREKEKEKRLQYLQNMPVAFCSVKVLVDEAGKPYDFQFIYCNRAHEELEGVEEGALLGKNFYEFFGETDPKWLQYYYQTAYEGVSQVIRRYSPEIQKYLLIYTFQLERGNCECVLMDISEEQFLTQELENSRENMRRILEMTTDFVFQYHLETGRFLLDRREKQRTVSIEDVDRMLTEQELVGEKDLEKLRECFAKIESGEHSVSVVIRARLEEGEQLKWYRVTMFDFQDGHTHERKILGFLQNIDQDMLREEEFRRRAEMDSLTEVFNAGAGRQKICKMLENRQRTEGIYYAMLIMDMDNFKTINDTRGHFMGDKALTEFASVLRRTFRAEDVIYRLGGDEFVVFIEKLHDPEQSIKGILHRFRLHMEEAKAIYPFLSCSIGGFVTDKPVPFEKCYEMADQALYEAKKQNKGDCIIRQDEKDRKK